MIDLDLHRRVISKIVLQKRRFFYGTRLPNALAGPILLLLLFLLFQLFLLFLLFLHSEGFQDLLLCLELGLLLEKCALVQLKPLFSVGTNIPLDDEVDEQDSEAEGDADVCNEPDVAPWDCLQVHTIAKLRDGEVVAPIVDDVVWVSSHRALAKNNSRSRLVFVIGHNAEHA